MTLADAMKIEIELSESLYKKVGVAAKNLKLSKKTFITRAIRRMTIANQEKQLTGQELTAELNKFFAENPEANVPWWKDRSWDDYQPDTSQS